MNLWKTNKNEFRKKYYSTEWLEVSSPYITFGKQIAELLEDKKKTKAHPVLSKIPLYPVREQPILHTIDDVPIKGFIDSFDKRWKKIIEIKTGIMKDGRAPWDPVKVRKHDQIRLYSLMVKEIFGSVHPVVKLIWLETCWKEKCVPVLFGGKEFMNCSPELELTGHFQVFDREIEEWEHDFMRREIVRIATEISEDYSRYLQFSTQQLSTPPTESI